MLLTNDWLARGFYHFLFSSSTSLLLLVLSLKCFCARSRLSVLYSDVQGQFYKHISASLRPWSLVSDKNVQRQGFARSLFHFSFAWRHSLLKNSRNSLIIYSPSFQNLYTVFSVHIASILVTFSLHVSFKSPQSEWILSYQLAAC